MKKLIILFTVLSILFFACSTTPPEEEIQQEEFFVPQVIIQEAEPVVPKAIPVEEPALPEPVVEEPAEPEAIEEAEPVTEPEDVESPVVLVEEEGVVTEGDEVIVPEADEALEEYLRSISSLSGEDVITVPQDVFEEDKNQIFLVISDLDRIMKKKDFKAWYAYLTSESAEYWSNKHNLTELSRHLFTAGDFSINNIHEYFEMFFIPARRGRLVDEIRYVTPTFVKVVQYKNNTDIIYYFFEKHGDEWKLKLDTNT